MTEKSPVVLSYDEALHLYNALETIRTLARGAIQDLRCGLPGRALIKLEQLEFNFPTSIGAPDAAQVRSFTREALAHRQKSSVVTPFRSIGEVLSGTPRPWL